MKGFVIELKGKGIDKIGIKEVKQPDVQRGEVLIKVKAVPLSSWERDIAMNDSESELTEMIDGHTLNLGLEFSGEVATDGERFKRGDRVVGSIDFVKDEKTMAEFIAVNEAYLAHLPETISYNEGASLPIGGETAYTALLKLADVKAGQKVLIIGANGGVGVYATQLAALYGANVTTISSKSALAKLKTLGATKTYAYTETSLNELHDKFDIIFDLAKTLTFKEAEEMLLSGGVFVNSNPQLDEEAESLAAVTDKKAPYLFVAHGTTEILSIIVTLVEAGKLRPIVESVYQASDYSKGFTDLLDKERFGKIILNFEKGIF